MGNIHINIRISQSKNYEDDRSTTPKSVFPWQNPKLSSEEQLDAFANYLYKNNLINRLLNTGISRFIGRSYQLTKEQFDTLSENVESKFLENLLTPEKEKDKSIWEKIQNMQFANENELNEFLVRQIAGIASTEATRMFANMSINQPVGVQNQTPLEETEVSSVTQHNDEEFSAFEHLTPDEIINKLATTEAMYEMYKKDRESVLIPGFIKKLKNNLELYGRLLDYYNRRVATSARDRWEPQDPTILTDPVGKIIQPYNKQQREYVRTHGTKITDISEKLDTLSVYQAQIDAIMPYIMRNIKTLAPRIANFLYLDWSNKENRYSVGLDPSDVYDQEFVRHYITGLALLQEELWYDSYLSKNRTRIPGEGYVRKMVDINQYMYNYIQKAIEAIKLKYPNIPQEKLDKYHKIAELINREKPEINKFTNQPKLNPDGSIKTSKPINIIRQQLDYIPMLLAKSEAAFRAKRYKRLPSMDSIPKLSREEAEKLADSMLSNSIFFSEPHRIMRSHSIDPTTGLPQNPNDLLFMINPQYLRDYLIELFMSGDQIPRLDINKLELKRVKKDKFSINPESVNRIITLLKYAQYYDNAGLHKYASYIDSMLGI